MQELIKQEQFELEVLDKLNSKRLLDNLVFCGGTMLRLCYGLSRYSVDLDFWAIKNIQNTPLFGSIKQCLAGLYEITDSADTFNTWLVELRSPAYPRKLKVEIRKAEKKVKHEQSIAYSKHSSLQVLLKTVSLADMMHAKIDAFLSRKEIRDVFDIEFLLTKGIKPEAGKEDLEKLLRGINALKQNDYAAKLGPLLEEEQRRYYTTENFKILKLAIVDRLKT